MVFNIFLFEMIAVNYLVPICRMGLPCGSIADPHHCVDGFSL
jgi:hypothetical protein